LLACSVLFESVDAIFLMQYLMHCQRKLNVIVRVKVHGVNLILFTSV